ncbi:helix-turn-helix domain-containing protein [Nocardia sp. NPDC050378]|uniref:TetR/AcrR family transcriptional regulator n=1 Tax=Nocardia sp. NPDC050378 TaxID=3155400 RepID=UPI003402395C
MTKPQVSLRARQRQQLRNDLYRVAIGLFADQGFDAVTVDDVAAAAGVSRSTVLRVATTKEALLIDPLLEEISGMVPAFAARPATESVAEAFIQATVEAMTAPSPGMFRTWLRAVRTAPHLLDRVRLVSHASQAELRRIAAARLGVDLDTSPLPRIVVTIGLAVSEDVFRRWISDSAGDMDSLPNTVDSELRLAMIENDWL